MRKIDIHCHILPGLDDGSASEEESMNMLRMAARQNIHAVIATPHCSGQYKNKNPGQIRYLCAKLEERARKEIREDFRIYPGQEIFYSEGILREIQTGSVLTLADSQYILIEFLPNVLYSSLYRIVRESVAAQYLPILAHVERYGALREKGRMEELIEAGAYMQMNYRRIGGKWYEETARWCRKMLKEEKIHFLGTDMHNTRERKPRTQEAEVWMEKHLDSRYFKEISFKNARQILANKTIEEKESSYGRYA